MARGHARSSAGSNSIHRGAVPSPARGAVPGGAVHTRVGNAPGLQAHQARVKASVLHFPNEGKPTYRLDPYTGKVRQTTRQDSLLSSPMGGNVGGMPANQRPHGNKNSGTFKNKLQNFGLDIARDQLNRYTGGGSSNLERVPSQGGGSQHFGFGRKRHKKLGISNNDLKSLVRVAKVIKLVSQVTHQKHHMKLRTHRKRSSY